MVQCLKNLILFLAPYDTQAGALPHPRWLPFHAFERRYTFPLRAISPFLRGPDDGLGLVSTQSPGKLGINDLYPFTM